MNDILYPEEEGQEFGEELDDNEDFESGDDEDDDYEPEESDTD